MGKDKLIVAAIENGTVIDHIPASRVFAVVDILGLQELSSTITIGSNLKSGKIGSKGLIKVADHYFSDIEIARIACVAPNIVINTIHNFEVVEKRKVCLPDYVVDTLKCNNPKCITNHEPMATRFITVDKNAGTLRCAYCNKEISVNEIVFK